MYKLTTQGPEPSGPELSPKGGKGQSELAIFSQDWWIEIARGSSDYRELKVVDGDVLLGKLPFVLTRNRVGLVRAHNPHWSHLGGPIINENLCRSDQAEVIHQLLEQLPRWTSFLFGCDPVLTYSDLVRQAFIRRGFEHSLQLTFVRHPSNNQVMCTRKSKHRGHIRRAAKELDCVQIRGDEFVRFYEANLGARDKKSYSPLGTLARLIDEAIFRGQARAIAALPNAQESAWSDRQSALYDAAIVYVWDSTRCYYWLSTKRPESADKSFSRPHPDAIKLLAAKAMEDAQAMKLIFDADGVNTPGAHNLYRNMFGLREESHRDVFRRSTFLEQLYERYCRYLPRHSETMDIANNPFLHWRNHRHDPS